MYIDVLMEIKSKHVDRTFTYFVPEEFRDKIARGCRVLVPFGHQVVEGYIIDCFSKTDVSNVKEMIDLLDQEPVLNEEMMELGKELQELTLSSLSSCYAAMLPLALRAKKGVCIHCKAKSYLFLQDSFVQALRQCQNEKQKQIVYLFQDKKQILKKEANDISASAMKTLIKKQILQEIDEEVYRYQLQSTSCFKPKVLNEEQQEVVEKVAKSYATPTVFLLHGVTGSGKTEVYLALIEGVLKRGKTALVLVPEISLTPQFIVRFNERFAGRIAVLHSSLSDGEKYDEWRKILREEVDIVIGARSAIFAPLKNLGIIILDEEHSDAYKQENAPKYHTRDIAILRGKTHHCPVLLGSATPSLSSMARAGKKVYQYLSLTKRANGSELPSCTIVDMAVEVKNRHPIISRELECKIIEKLNRKEQILLLLNRRGHSTVITCSNCGFTYKCPYCEISLTYHKSSNSLRCHYCGYTKIREEVCPNCHEDGLNFLGLGTEKLEDYLKNIFPTARIIRMDRDSTSKKGSYERIIEEFQNYQYDILLGTQMISKGLDFPKVSLVGVLNADMTLNIPDFRSNERTFDLLYQVSGRAGRAHTTGEVIIQTYYPTHFILDCVKKNSYFAFYKSEMKMRKNLKYPPFYYIVVVTVKGKDYESTSFEAKKVRHFLENNLDPESIILGPATANLFLVNRVYHFEILVKYRFDQKLKEILKELDEMYLIHSKVNIDIDFFS